MPLDLTTIPEQCSHIFDQVQISVSNHRKNHVALYKLHKQASTVTTSGRNAQSVKLVGEKAFVEHFLFMIGRTMAVKKGVSQADRVIRFGGSYAKFISDKAGQGDEEAMVSRFISRVLKWIMGAFQAKDKNVRFRALQLTSEMIAHLGEIDEDTYALLRQGLFDRLKDKEPSVRALGVVALSKLVGSADPEESDEEDRLTLQTLLDCLATDPAVEVRRSALVNTPLTRDTLHAIMDRAKDVDTLTRKLVYTRVLTQKLTHPKQLTIAQREQVVKEGLGDREPVVRLAAGKLITQWLDIFQAEEEEKLPWTGDDAGVMHGLVRLLRAFDPVGPGVDMASDALSAVFSTRPSVIDAIVFEDDYWEQLTAESAILARTFVQHCTDNKLTAALDSAKLPVVTAVAFYTQRCHNKLLECAQAVDILPRSGDGEEEEDPRETELLQQETVLGELLRIAVTLDYGDELGRRKMFMVVREMVGQEVLPESLVERCMDVLHELTPNERDLIMVVVELVVALRDDDEGDVLEGLEPPNDASQSDISRSQREPSMRRQKPREEMAPEEAAHADSVDMRCLLICITMLQRVQGALNEHTMLEGILADLVVPSVRRKEPAIRERGLTSLALSCLLAKGLALNSFQLFLNQVQGSGTELRGKVLQALFDLLITYDEDFLGRTPDAAQQLVDFLLSTFEAETNDENQAIICVGLSKLLLSGVLPDGTDVLIALLIAYVNPSTHDNQGLRQCLSYFFPIYTYSSSHNQSRMRSTFTTVFDMVAQMYQDKEEDEIMITPHQLALQIIDWADPQKCADKAANKESHADLAVDILAALYEPTRKGEHDRDLCQSLNQLHLSSEIEDRSLLKLNLLLSNVQDMESISNDTTALKAVEKFRTKLGKDFGERIDDLDIQLFLDDDLVRLYDIVGIEAPERAEPPEAPPAEANAQEDGQEPEPAPNGELEANGHDNTENGDENMEQDAPEERKERSKTPTTASPDQATQSADEDAHDDPEDRATTPTPLPTSNGSKRLRSPSATKVMPVPAATKRARTAAPRKPKATAAAPPTRKSTRATRKGKATTANDAESGDDPFT